MTSGVFVDWLSIAQVHAAGGLPQVDAGVVLGCNSDGEVEWQTTRAVKHEGSHETSVNIRCDGYRVAFSGNVSRFGRPDNLFGFGFEDALTRVNAILAAYGLPPFTRGRLEELDDHGTTVVRWNGARVSRIDLTRNYEAGSADDAHAFLQWIGSQHAGRKTGRVLGQGETVDFGGIGNGKDGTSGSRRQYWKVYIKHLEMRRHGACERSTEYARRRGIVRLEGTIRSNTLNDIGASHLADYERGHAMGELIKLFEQRAELLHRAEHAADDWSALPRHLRATARDYLAGMDCVATMRHSTFKRHRKLLLPYGIDIAVRNVRPFTPRVRVIELRPAEVPSWYRLVA